MCFHSMQHQPVPAASNRPAVLLLRSSVSGSSSALVRVAMVALRDVRDARALVTSRSPTYKVIGKNCAIPPRTMMAATVRLTARLAQQKAC